MPQNAISLPTDKKELARFIRMHVERERRNNSYRRTTWRLAWYYLNGVRRFDVFDPINNTISHQYLDKDGNMEFQSQDLLSMIDRTTARLSTMDLRPKIMRQGSSLSMIRERSAAQIVANAIISDHQLAQVAADFSHIFVTLGCCGITGHLHDVASVGLSADLEVVHPRELFPFPTMQQDHTKQCGLIRQRVIPIDIIEERFDKKFNEEALSSMEWWTVDYGNVTTDLMLDEPGEGVRNAFNNTSVVSGTSGATTDKSWTRVARIRELWLDGPRGTCSRYVVTCGDVVIFDESYTDITTYCPIGFARFCDTGTFYGAGLFDLLFGISREAEKLMKSLFNNIRDTDQYGVMVLPQGAFNERALLRDVGHGLRVMTYQPDALADNFKPFSIQPWNSGDAPAKVAELARDIMRQISPVQDLIQEKGRIDSGVGLQYLDEQIAKAMTNPTAGIQRAFGNMYRSLTAKAVGEVAKHSSVVPVATLTLDLAGAIIDMENSTVSFAENPVPNISHLDFSVRETNPRSEAARKDEAMNLLKMQVSDPTSFRIFAQQEGLDFAYWSAEDSGAIEVATTQILQCYNDGITPGRVVMVPFMVKPDIQLRYLMSFMVGPIAAAASTEVKTALGHLRETYINFMGQTLPKSVPTPEEAATMFPGGDPGQPPQAEQQGPPTGQIGQ